MKIGIFGGTFNPPHTGHIEAARAASEKLGLDKLLLMPDGQPPHKRLPENSPTAEDRLNMLSIAAEDLDMAEICGMEIERGGVSYTVDTLRELRAKYPGDELFLLVGTDMFLSLETWRESENILRSVNIAVFCRADGESGPVEEYAGKLRKKYGARITEVKNKAVEISSEELRRQLQSRGGTVYLNDNVYAYIIKNRLYGAKPSFDWLRRKAHNMLLPKRSLHVIGCEEEAVKLAARWGGDEEEARTAAILHDITKNLELDEQLLLCEKYGIITDNAEREGGKLLHAKTGAAVAKEEFGVSDRVYSAIFWHTTGKADMSLLDKIIYLADYIEPHRDFDGLRELRSLAYTDLDGALLRGLEMSLEDLTYRGIQPHMRTLDAIAWLKHMS